jgi:hypothetical protein
MSPATPEREERIPWYVWLAVLGVTSAMIGIHWDISWHKSIGRDTFWTPAHIAIQLCGVIAGITCGYLILATTFTRNKLRQSSVNVFGFRGPLGAFISAWGGFAMITSAPFDDWWHSAYGLDVKILSPPHIVLALGMFGVEIGVLVLVAAQMNRASESGSAALRRRLENLFLYTSAMILIAAMVLVLEFTGRIFLHSAICYRTIAMLAPITLNMASRATGRRWGGTTVAAIYTVFLLGMEWILPLFPAQPKLGPVMHETTQFIPNGFPLLLLVPAFLMDLIRPRVSQWKKPLQALAMGSVFLASFIVAEWPFGTFLQSPAARNAFFGSNYFEYFVGPKSYSALYKFVQFEKTPGEFWTNIALAFLAAVLASRLGLMRGEWLGRVRR